MTQAMVLDDLDWMSDAHDLLVKVAATGAEFNAYTLSEAGLREPPNANMWGTLFREANRLWIIEHLGWLKSSRPARKGGVCSRWKARS